MENQVKTDPNGVCPQFERVSWSLIEEPEICALCAGYDEDCGVCRKGQ